MPNWVNGDGNSNASLVLVGEAPGKWEDFYGKPFVGSSGELVNEMLTAAGMPRNKTYTTNVVKLRPPDNDLKRLNELGKTLNDFIPSLWDEINTVEPNCILALGNLALETLTGKVGITHWRGSILKSIQGDYKVVPTVHPANLLEHRAEGIYNWKHKAYIQHDFDRAVQESYSKEYDIPQRSIWIARNSVALAQYLERNKDCDKVCIDVEVWKALLLCIGLSFSKAEGVSIPIIDDRISRKERAVMLQMVAEVLYDNRIKKIGQNLKFDCKILREHLFPVNNVYSDVMLKFHSIYSEFPKRLEFITSILTREPYYKHEGKEFIYGKDNLDKYLLYNARDAAVEFECDEILESELDEFGVREFFYDFMMPLHEFYSDLEDVGLLLDKEQHTKIVAKYTDLIRREEAQLFSFVGREVNVNSNPDLIKLLYQELNLPIRLRKRQKGNATPSADEKAITGLLANTVKDASRQSILQSILKIRGYYKTKGTYLGAPKISKTRKCNVFYEDKDGRVRTSYLIVGTESGRTSTNKIGPPLRQDEYGLAFQTITKYGEEGNDIRSCFIAPEGHELIEVDQSQAEARVVLLLAEDYETLQAMDSGVDLHILTASWVYNKSYDDMLAFYESIDKTAKDNPRQLGKVTRHGGNYDMKAPTMVSEAADKFGIIISEKRATIALERFHERSPGIRNIYHYGIRNALETNNRVLVNPFGRKRSFYNKWGDELFREAYAHIPQSTIADATKRAGVFLRRNYSWLRANYENHDSLIFESPIGKREEATAAIKEAFEMPINFEKCSLSRGSISIPCDFKIGQRWRDMKDYTPPKNDLQSLLKYTQCQHG